MSSRTTPRRSCSPADTPPSSISDYLPPSLPALRQTCLPKASQDEAITFQPLLDMRYQGQSYELTIPWLSSRAIISWRAFHAAHQSTYGYSLAAIPVEIVNLRLHAVGHIPPIPLPSQTPPAPDPQSALLDRRPVVLLRPSPSAHPPLPRRIPPPRQPHPRIPPSSSAAIPPSSSIPAMSPPSTPSSTS